MIKDADRHTDRVAFTSEQAATLSRQWPLCSRRHGYQLNDDIISIQLLQTRHHLPATHNGFDCQLQPDWCNLFQLTQSQLQIRMYKQTGRYVPCPLGRHHGDGRKRSCMSCCDRRRPLRGANCKARQEERSITIFAESVTMLSVRLIFGPSDLISTCGLDLDASTSRYGSG